MKEKTYKLAGLLAQCDPKAPLPEEMKTWMDVKPVCKEIWMTKQTQQDYLKLAKEELTEMNGVNVTWDAFASLCGIESRAFKTYRMPETSKDYRTMSGPVVAAVARVLEDKRTKVKRKLRK